MTTSGSETGTVQKTRNHRQLIKPVRVVISAPSSLALAGLERLLHRHPSVHIVGAVNGTVELQSAVAESDPDVVLVHLESRTPGLDWKELSILNVPVVLLADEADIASVTTALVGGVKAVLVGDTTAAELAAAVCGAAAGALTLSGNMADLVRQGLLVHLQEESDDFEEEAAAVADGSPERLTLREREVLEMMTEGLSNKEIAAQLNISAHTVKFHISSILGKLGASSRTEAVAIGLRRGIVTI